VPYVIFLPEQNSGIPRGRRVRNLAQRAYEAMVILNPNMGEEQITAATQRISDQIAARGGEVGKVDTWGRRRMYFPIKHVRDGHYVIYDFTADPQEVRQLESGWLLTEDVLRHLVVKKSE
jgi:small subunit ribosomal protein S6